MPQQLARRASRRILTVGLLRAVALRDHDEIAVTRRGTLCAQPVLDGGRPAAFVDAQARLTLGVEFVYILAACPARPRICEAHAARLSSCSMVGCLASQQASSWTRALAPQHPGPRLEGQCNLSIVHRQDSNGDSVAHSEPLIDWRYATTIGIKLGDVDQPINSVFHAAEGTKLRNRLDPGLTDHAFCRWARCEPERNGQGDDEETRHGRQHRKINLAAPDRAGQKSSFTAHTPQTHIHRHSVTRECTVMDEGQTRSPRTRAGGRWTLTVLVTQPYIGVEKLSVDEITRKDQSSAKVSGCYGGKDGTSQFRTLSPKFSSRGACIMKPTGGKSSRWTSQISDSSSMFLISPHSLCRPCRMSSV